IAPPPSRATTSMTITSSRSVKPLAPAASVLAAKVIFVSFDAVGTEADDLELGRILATRETVAVFLLPRIGRHAVRDLGPVLRHRRAGRLFHQRLEALLGGRVVPGVDLVGLEGG